MKHYNSGFVVDTDGACHDFGLYTSSYDWGVRLRAVRRFCEERGIKPQWAYIGGNSWSRYEIARA
jgi:hypothetical protein